MSHLPCPHPIGDARIRVRANNVPKAPPPIYDRVFVTE